MTKQEQAEQAEQKAYEASEKAESAQTVEAYTAAAKANFEAAKAHREHAETGAQEAAGNAAEYADSPEEAATGCEIEGYRFDALAVKRAEIKAEEAEAKAYEASSLAADASDIADDQTRKTRADAKETVDRWFHLQAAQAHDRAAHANSMASIAHQVYADAGGTSPAGSSSDYADTPAEAAKACKSEMERHMAEAIYHRKQADIGIATVGFLVNRGSNHRHMGSRRDRPTPSHRRIEMTEKRREMEARLRAEKEARQTGDKAYKAEFEASFGWMKARDQKTEQAYLTSANLYEKAAQAYTIAAETHQAHANAGGKRAAGQARRYAGQTPARAAKWCLAEAKDYTTLATTQRRVAAELEAAMAKSDCDESTKKCFYCEGEIIQAQLNSADACGLGRGRYTHIDCIARDTAQP